MEYNDICHFKWFPNLKVLHIDEYHIPSERTMFSLLRDDPNSKQYRDWKYHPRTPLKIDVCKQILDRAFEYTTKPELHDYLILILEGYTLFTKNSYKGTFLYGWMIIETFLAKLWKEYVDSLAGRSKNDKAALKDFRSWTSYHHIEMFSALGKMEDTTVRNLFNQLRKNRNSITHSREDVEEREAVGCLRVSRTILLNRLRNQSPFLDLEKNELVELWKLKDMGRVQSASER